MIIGVDAQDGRPSLPPVGIDPNKIDSIQKELRNLGNSAIQPNYHPRTATYVIDGHAILAVWVPGGENRPYKAKVDLFKKHSEWAYFIRRHSSTILAKGLEENELIGLAATVPFDDRYCQTASLEDLSYRLIQQYLSEVDSELKAQLDQLSISDLGHRMNIIGGPPEAMFLKNVGLLLFNDQPHNFFPVTQIDVVWFPDGPGGDSFEEKEFRGPIWLILRDAISFIQRNYLKAVVVKHPHRPEAERIWNFPIDAVEEALVNAIYHRSYEMREPVEVRVSPEEMIIISYPGADRSVSMEDLRKGRAVNRRYRNRRIGEFLKELDLAEGRSTGVPKILRAMQQNGSSEPVFESDDCRTSFLVRLPAHSRMNVVSTAQDTAQDTVLITRQIERVIVALNKEMSRAELQDELNLSHRKNFTKSYLQPALKAGLIELTIPDKPTSKNQCYRRTVKGEELAGRMFTKSIEDDTNQNTI